MAVCVSATTPLTYYTLAHIDTEPCNVCRFDYINPLSSSWSRWSYAATWIMKCVGSFAFAINRIERLQNRCFWREISLFLPWRLRNVRIRCTFLKSTALGDISCSCLSWKCTYFDKMNKFSIYRFVHTRTSTSQLGVTALNHPIDRYSRCMRNVNFIFNFTTEKKKHFLIRSTSHACLWHGTCVTVVWAKQIRKKVR